uniref:GDSL-like Lipase/Acylhydrolase family n=1 Tax=Candidatus Kentrum sp. SD TaxID=2126332 RepID=A0A451BMQ7_9GAMM|nr:MAG: GDSL-like Lipase/Acylhydrolase family [Candidatus Kentron sp. SD]
MSSIKKLSFYLILYSLSALPLLVIFYFLFFTNFPQTLYTDSIRNIYFDCVDFVSDKTVYRLKPGECPLNNIEFDTFISSDDNGYRNAKESTANDIIVIGDSHAHGFGVNDKETFSSILSRELGVEVLNLGMGSYDTVRELEALKQFSSDERFVVIQYCDNDYGGNKFFLKNSGVDYSNHIRRGWVSMAKQYFERKSRGFLEILKGVPKAIILTSSNSNYYDMSARNIDDEASVFASVLANYSKVLENKTIIIFESSGWGKNHPKFSIVFSSAISKVILEADVRVLNSYDFLDRSKYYFLDGHLNFEGHEKIAAVLGNMIRVEAR